MDQLKEEYLKSSKQNHKYLALGIVMSSMVFVVPFLIIIINGWWDPLGSAEIGYRWVITGGVLLTLIYLALIFDKFYRKH